MTTATTTTAKESIPPPPPPPPKTRYHCYFSNCPMWFFQEVKLHAHLLFAHQFFLAQCSTQVAEQQHLEAQTLREEWKKLHHKSTDKTNYIRKRYKKSIFCVRSYPVEGGGIAMTPLERWLKHIHNGEGWLQNNRKEEALYESKQYDALRPRLRELHEIIIRKKAIENQCNMKGYLLLP